MWQGDSFAQASLTFAYGRGAGVTRDEAAAIRLYALAAAQGNVKAKANLAYYHHVGSTVARNRTECILN
ncbi:hypothetical protein T492DRAFT_1048093 [Pavlovales sp. CCMP2436]|nr:hypothetical protein T492DRAFT_1048093 [Pavlovales sp. CCMP2436]